MTLIVSVQSYDLAATYEVKHEMDGIYKATLSIWGLKTHSSFPEKIILIKSDDDWTYDCINKDIGLQISRKIIQQENLSTVQMVKDHGNMPETKEVSKPVVPCRILIIDDDEDDVSVLSTAFTQCGVSDIYYVFSAMQAFIYLQEMEHSMLPKLIITDHYLPGLTGAEFLQDLKGMEKYRHIHVVVLSNTKSEKQLEKYRELGILDYQVKPNSYEDYIKVASEMKSRAGL